MDDVELERLIADETEASEHTRDEPMRYANRRGATRSTVYSIRLAPEEVESIQRVADEAGIPPAGLVRSWVLQGLASERDDALSTTVEALSREVAKLQRQLAKRCRPDAA